MPVFTTQMTEDNGFKEAEQRIQQAVDDGSLSLDLRDLELENVPKTIGQLTQLQALYLSNNQLSTLPEAIGQLTQLQELDLNGNQLSTLPEAIGQLTQLQTLELADNQLSILPEAIGQLTRLQDLNLRGNQLSTLPEAIDQLTRLQILDLSFNQLSILPEAIGELTRLQALDLTDNQLSTLPEAICQLTRLQILDLSFNQLSTLPEAIGQLAQLQELKLYSNQLSTLPEAIIQLTQLQELKLNSNQLSSLPEAIIQLTRLQALSLNDNQLSTLPEAIGELTRLQALYLVDNQLSTLPEAFTQLTQLQVLYLGSNQLSTLPEAIGQLPQLQTLDLTDNQLSTLPEAIGQLTQLQYLGLGYNQLSTLPEAIGQLTQLQELQLNDNPLETPPYEIAIRGIDAIRDYFKQIEEQGGVDYLYEAKLLIVGDPGAGKTTLLNKLIDPDYPVPNIRDSTIGVNIHPGWEFPFKLNDTDTVNFRTNIWDFGGHQIQYMTHQFFLTTRSLYVLVTDDREQKTNFDYWFNIIEILGNKSPTLVLLNEKNHDSITNFDSKKYHDLFPHFKESISVDFSNPDDGRCKSSRLRIQHYLTHLKHIGEELPKQWIPIRKAIEVRRSEGQNFIDFNEYQTICRQHEIVKDSQQLKLSQYFHDLGVILHYQHDDDLFNRVILNPNWVVDAVYTILKDKTVYQNNGRFTKDWLFSVWDKDYAGDEKRFLLLLMLKRKFDICYPVNRQNNENNTQYIVPQLLPNKELTYTWDYSDNLILRYSYPFLPYGLIARLIVRLNEWIDTENEELLNWQSGCVLVKDQARSLVRQLTDKGQLVIEIRSTGPKVQRLALLQKVSNTLLDLNKESYHEVKCETLIPCNHCLERGMPDPNYWKLRHLNNYIEKNQNRIPCGECGGEISPIVLVLGIFTRENIERQPSITHQTIVKGDLNLGDKNINKGQAVVVGRNAHAHDINFNQIWKQNKTDIDLKKLSEELATLREALTPDAKQAEQFAELANISTAESEAKEGNGAKALEAMSKIGTWGLGVAEKIGVSLVTTYIKTTMGL